MTIEQINNLPSDDLKIWRLCRECKTNESLLRMAGSMGIPIIQMDEKQIYIRDDGQLVEVKPDPNMCHVSMLQPTEDKI